MAEYTLRSLDRALEVYSAGTVPAQQVHPMAVAVMKEAGIDLGGAVPKSVDRFTGGSFDYLITVCDNARETCPVFVGTVRNRLHIGFPDPADARGSEDEVLAVYRNVRDAIMRSFRDFYSTQILPPRRETAS